MQKNVCRGLGGGVRQCRVRILWRLSSVSSSLAPRGIRSLMRVMDSPWWKATRGLSLLTDRKRGYDGNGRSRMKLDISCNMATCNAVYGIGIPPNGMSLWNEKRIALRANFSCRPNVEFIRPIRYRHGHSGTPPALAPSGRSMANAGIRDRPRINAVYYRERGNCHGTSVDPRQN